MLRTHQNSQWYTVCIVFRLSAGSPAAPLGPRSSLSFVHFSSPAKSILSNVSCTSVSTCSHHLRPRRLTNGGVTVAPKCRHRAPDRDQEEWRHQWDGWLRRASGEYARAARSGRHAPDCAGPCDILPRDGSPRCRIGKDRLLACTCFLSFF